MDFQSIILNAVPILLGVGVIAVIVGKAVNFLKQVSDVLVAIVEALEDNNVTKKEVNKIVDEFKDVIKAVKAFVKK